MTGPQRHGDLLELFVGKAPIAKTLGMSLTFTEDDRAVIVLPYNPAFDQGIGLIHGGVYATLLDTAGWFTSAAARGGSTRIVTTEMSLHFLRPARRTALRAEAWLIKRGKRQDFLEMRLWDAEGELVGHATGTFLHLPGN